MDQYDYVLINDDLETCVKQMHETIQSQHFMSSNQKDFIEQMKKKSGKIERSIYYDSSILSGTDCNY